MRTPGPTFIQVPKTVAAPLWEQEGAEHRPVMGSVSDYSPHVVAGLPDPEAPLDQAIRAVPHIDLRVGGPNFSGDPTVAAHVAEVLGVDYTGAVGDFLMVLLTRVTLGFDDALAGRIETIKGTPSPGGQPHRIVSALPAAQFGPVLQMLQTETPVIWIADFWKLGATWQARRIDIHAVREPEGEQEA